MHEFCYASMRDVLRVKEGEGLMLKRVSEITVLPIQKDGYVSVVFCTSGTMIIDSNGKQQRLDKNSILVSARPMKDTDKYRVTSDFKCWQILFTMKEAFCINMYGKCSLADLVFLNDNPCIQCTDAEAQRMNDYYELFCLRMTDDSVYYHKNIVRSLLSAFLRELLLIVHARREELKDAADNELTAHTDGRKWLTNRFFELLEEADGRIRTVVDCSKLLNVTPNALKNAVMHTLGYNPREVIRMFTMMAVDRRLRYTDMTTQEIAYDVHFYDASMLCKYVKDNFSLSPLEYRKAFCD